MENDPHLHMEEEEEEAFRLLEERKRMVKTGRWFTTFFLAAKKGKGDGKKIHQEQLPTFAPNSKKRWSFRRSPKDHRSTNSEPSPANHEAVPTKSSASADAADLTSTRTRVEEVAAVKIQASYKAYLARKALKALKGLVKLQAQIRGQLVRKQTTSMLRCMEALVAAQARARIQRIQFLENAAPVYSKKQPPKKGGPLMEDGVKYVEMDPGDRRNSYPSSSMERRDRRLPSRYRNPPVPEKSEELQQHSPAISGIIETSPRTCSDQFDERSFMTVRSSPNHFLHDYALLLQQEDSVSVSKSCSMFFPNYMANTESSRAKARSQTAPRRRSDARRPPLDGRYRITPMGVRSSSRVGLLGDGSVKFHKSDASTCNESECESIRTFVSNTNNWRL